MITVRLIPILADNYCYLLTHGEETAIVDPGDALSVLQALKEYDLKPTKIFITHHHGDHIAGILDIKRVYGCQVYVPAKEAFKIPGHDALLNDGESIMIGAEEGLVIATPGHTSGHLSFWFKDSRLLFTGDALFSLGCGRLMEGTAEDLYNSLQRLKDLPDDTQVYCGHEYTQTNAAFALSQDPNNQAIRDKLAHVKKLRANDLPTLPAMLGEEKALNPFLTCKSAEAFATLRRLKDQF